LNENQSDRSVNTWYRTDGLPFKTQRCRSTVAFCKFWAHDQTNKRKPLLFNGQTFAICKYFD